MYYWMFAFAMFMSLCVDAMVMSSAYVISFTGACCCPQFSLIFTTKVSFLHQANIIFVTELFDILNNDGKTVIFDHIFIIDALQVYIFRNETPICQKKTTHFTVIFSTFYILS